ncbi:MAG: YsnF/AvaK domain-containing protein [Chloroflexota bacterium]|nr:YsnF/AvaK domain-containing protein [Chloroflexota bacterium]MDP9472185.1 YsnF/AvaK domain-containing protein [Chloroflexota bacterium]
MGSGNQPTHEHREGGRVYRHAGEDHPDGGIDHRAVEGDVVHAVEGETLDVPVFEEELTATTREREVGEVQVSKDVVAEEQVLEVPVTEERVRVQRRAVQGNATPDANAFQEGTFEVPIRGEEVELQKHTRVAEEVEIAKEAVQHTEQVGGTVRREEVVVEETTPNTGTRGTGTSRTS